MDMVLEIELFDEALQAWLLMTFAGDNHLQGLGPLSRLQPLL
jgi:hypothetical protein